MRKNRRAVHALSRSQGVEHGGGWRGGGVGVLHPEVGVMQSPSPPFSISAVMCAQYCNTWGVRTMHMRVSPAIPSVIFRHIVATRGSARAVCANIPFHSVLAGCGIADEKRFVFFVVLDDDELRAKTYALTLQLFTSSYLVLM